MGLVVGNNGDFTVVVVTSCWLLVMVVGVVHVLLLMRKLLLLPEVGHLDLLLLLRTRFSYCEWWLRFHTHKAKAGRQRQTQ